MVYTIPIKMYIARNLEPSVMESLEYYPVTAVIGPRQCGKSTLVKHILEQNQNSLYLDLERPSDLSKLDDSEWFLSSQKGKLICIDEIQRSPELFPLLRSLVDEWGGNGRFLILGSASRDLLKQSSETLAGRISYKRLTPFMWSELEGKYSFENYYAQGGFPRSLLKSSIKISLEWREDFISTFLERDLLQWTGFSPQTMRRLWQMLAHRNGQLVNLSVIASSLGVSGPTVRNYIDLLEGTFMVEVLPPYISNLGKRLVKSPKVYISDSGITAALLGLGDFTQLSGHPIFGSLWEQIVLTNLKGHFPNSKFFFYRTTNGAEVDIVMEFRSKVFAIECKSSLSPVLSKGNYNGIADINPTKSFVAAPVKNGWAMAPGIDVVSLDEIITALRSYG